MKNLFVLSFIIFSISAGAQDFRLWGTTIDGADGEGSLFSIQPNGKGLIVPHSFTESSYVRSSLIQAANGDLFGISSVGGEYGFGTVFKIKPDGSGYNTLFDFTQNDGSDAMGGLFEGTSGELFGTTWAGGTANFGVIFKIKTDGTGFTKLKDMTVTSDGASPNSTLIQLTEGVLVGTTGGGGNFGYGGVIFRINEDGSGYSKIFDFNPAIHGQTPNALILYNGFLYGMCSYGGAHDLGTIFKVKPDGTGFVKLFDFDDTNGSYPRGGFQITSTGDLIGLTESGGTYDYGVLFKIKTDGSGFLKLATFNNANGKWPNGSLSKAPDGSFYGMTYTGGTEIKGVIFKINSDGTNFIKLYDLNEESGHSPLTSQVTFVTTQPQVISFEPVSDKVFGDEPFQLEASSSTLMPITFLPSDNSILEIESNEVTILGPGKVTIEAYQEGDLVYSAASQSQTICISPAKPTISNLNDYTLVSSSSIGNQWYKDGLPIEGATDQTYNLIKSGTYHVNVTIKECISEDSDEMNLTVTGLSENIENGINISVHPNPANEIITIAHELPTMKPINIQVLDLMGQSLAVIHVNEIDEAIALDIRNYPKGSYYVRVIQGGKAYFSKFIKN